jgi:hypothetical protein
MPNYSLKHARSGSDRWTASSSPLINSTSPLLTGAIVSLSDFHKVSRAAGPKGQMGKNSRVPPQIRTIEPKAMKIMTLSKRTGLILSLLIATTCCTLGCGDKPERLDLSAEQWREDLKYLAHTLPARHANRQIEHLNRDAMWPV